MFECSTCYLPTLLTRFPEPLRMNKNVMCCSLLSSARYNDWNVYLWLRALTSSHRWFLLVSAHVIGMLWEYANWYYVMNTHLTFSKFRFVILFYEISFLYYSILYENEIIIVYVLLLFLPSFLSLFYLVFLSFGLSFCLFVLFYFF